MTYGGGSHAGDPAFWRGILPAFGIESEPAPLPFDRLEAEALSKHYALRADGFAHLPGVAPAEAAEELGGGVAELAARGLPAVCVFLYDRPWHLLAAMAPRIAGAFGSDYLLMANFWAWHVPNDDAQTGFAVHRDFYEPMIGPSGAPLSVNLWIALGAAPVSGSCLYFLPARYDPNYPFRLEATAIDSPRDIVARPASAGDVICVGANVLHWGSRGTRSADLTGNADPVAGTQIAERASLATWKNSALRRAKGPRGRAVAAVPPSRPRSWPTRRDV